MIWRQESISSKRADGHTPTWFNFPTDLTINNYGQLIVADIFNSRIQVLELGSGDIRSINREPSAEEFYLNRLMLKSRRVRMNLYQDNLTSERSGR